MKLIQLFEGTRPNLDALYKKFNRKYFDNELPDIKIKWSNSTRTAGRVVMLYYRKQNRIELQHLEISSHTVLDDDRLNGLMVHEMIHVYVAGVMGIAETTGGNKHHGLEFEFKRRELQRRTPFDIPLTEDLTDAVVSDHIKIKTPVVVIIRNETGVFAVKKAAFDKHLDDFIGRFRKGASYEIILSDSNILTKIPIARTLPKRGVSYYQLNKKDIQTIINTKKKRYVSVTKDGKLIE